MNEYHLGCYVRGHDTGICVLDSSKADAPLIFEEAKFTGNKLEYLYPRFSLEELLKRGITRYKSLTFAHLPWSDPFFSGKYHIEKITGPVMQANIKRYISKHFSWEHEYNINHHYSHALGAYMASGFEDCYVLTIDGSGELLSLALYVTQDDKQTPLRLLEKQKMKNFSYGAFYKMATNWIGYTENSFIHAGKVMGLSSYGKPVYLELLKKSYCTAENEYIKQNMSYEEVFSSIHPRFKAPVLGFTKEQANFAKSIQQFLEEEIINKLIYWKTKYPKFDKLCLGGGVAMNSQLNGIILREKIFDSLFIFPAASDCGHPYSAACHGLLQSSSSTIKTTKWKTIYHGYKANLSAEINDFCAKYNIPGLSVNSIEHTTEYCVDRLLEGKILAIIQGQQEVGARALGNRSILCMPNILSRDTVNKKVKYRENWRPFAPVVIEEDIGKYFEFKRPEPFMTVIYKVKKKYRKILSGINHVDNTARVQSVNKEQNPLLYEILLCLKRKGKPPILLNTSFNINGQAIVRTVYDAVITFMCCGIDELIVGNKILGKNVLLDKSYISSMDRTLSEMLKNVQKVDIIVEDLGLITQEIIKKLMSIPSLRFRKDKFSFDNFYLINSTITHSARDDNYNHPLLANVRYQKIEHAKKKMQNKTILISSSFSSHRSNFVDNYYRGNWEDGNLDEFRNLKTDMIVIDASQNCYPGDFFYDVVYPDELSEAIQKIEEFIETQSSIALYGKSKLLQQIIETSQKVAKYENLYLIADSKNIYGIKTISKYELTQVNPDVIIIIDKAHQKKTKAQLKSFFPEADKRIIQFFIDTN